MKTTINVINVFLTILLTFLVASHAVAGPIDFDRARFKAELFLRKDVVATNALTTKVRQRVTVKSPSPAYYVFNSADGKGFVVISGDDAMPLVLAYSFTNFFDAEKMHPGLADLLGSYTELVNEARCGNVDMENPSFASAPKLSVQPLCDSQWGQEAPYNTLCPQKNGEECPVGCVATAMAQIMHHFKWPVVGKGYMRYASGISGVGVLSSNFYEHYYAWEEMKATKKENMASEAASAAVAQLSYDCAVSVKMSFDPEGSGTNDDLAMAALYTYFGYKASPLHIEYRDCYATIEEWIELVKSEISANRPVLYSAVSGTGGGHEFIIDGYDEEDNFHVNWGWDGSADGYYPIISLRPKRTSVFYSDVHQMICGIEPDSLGSDVIPQQWRLYQYTSPEVTVDTCEVGSSFKYSLGKYYNRSRTAHTWTYAVALYTLDGNQLDVFSKKGKNSTEQYLSYYGPTQSPSINVTIPAEIPDGYYVLSSVYRQRETDADGNDIYADYVLPNMEGGSELNRIPIYIHDGIIEFNQNPPIVDEDVNQDGVVDTQDVLQVYDVILHSAAAQREDVNHDGVVDTQDVLFIYDYMLKN